jgi:hypothetical protein
LPISCVTIIVPLTWPPEQPMCRTNCPGHSLCVRHNE